MNTRAALIGTWAIAVLAVSTVGAAAQTALEKAIDAGAKQLTSEEIADLIVGKTVTAKSGEKRFLFHYSMDNVLSGKLIGGNWSGTGYYGITDDNRVCLSMSKDKGRLRCLTFLKSNGVVKKFNVSGDMRYELLEFREGKHL